VEVKDQKQAVDIIRLQMSSDDTKTAAWAARTLLDVSDHNLRIFELRDKLERLDSGKPTEITSDKRLIEVRADSLFNQVRALLGDRPREVIDVEPTPDADAAGGGRRGDREGAVPDEPGAGEGGQPVLER